MDLTPYVENLRNELAVAAAAGGEDARELAERLTAPLESATRLMLLGALSAAMGEVTQELAPGSVDVRLRGVDPEFVVTPAPTGEVYVPMPDGASVAPPVPAAVPAEGEEGTARINFRLPAHLKSRVEDAASREGLSVNAWLVRAVATALEPADRGPADRVPGGGRRRGGQTFTGWVR
ncbi:hypothetical protein [Kitasatospora viridis]|uniref:HicB-like protein involved in pilus formation n=1 Tax=Kitasatospora viridis TaxID=281105 RepID=A0A561UJR2_9ACTN|nr:hypothetical protein [Kitasatospora viridis]TWF99598.1 hypothetical protein FHX73_113445 [Kitasatospora viridis]